MGRKLLVVVFAVLGLAGLAVVPGYWAYARYVAGEELASFDVYGGDKTLSGADAVTFPASDERGWRTPVRIKLSPEMSPVLLRLNISSRPPLGPGEHSIRYEVALRSAARSLVEETVVFTEERGQERERGTETAVLSWAAGLQPSPSSTLPRRATTRLRSRTSARRQASPWTG